MVSWTKLEASLRHGCRVGRKNVRDSKLKHKEFEDAVITKFKEIREAGHRCTWKELQLMALDLPLLRTPRTRHPHGTRRCFTVYSLPLAVPPRPPPCKTALACPRQVTHQAQQLPAQHLLRWQQFLGQVIVTRREELAARRILRRRARVQETGEDFPLSAIINGDQIPVWVDSTGKFTLDFQGNKSINLKTTGRCAGAGGRARRRAPHGQGGAIVSGVLTRFFDMIIWFSH